MNELTNQFNNQNNSVLTVAVASREMEEVKGQVFMAKQFPRDIFLAEKRIADACKRQSLAKTAVYSYPRGGTKVTGPSIRLAEVVAQNWGNMAFGIKELEQKNGESTAMAYAWDLETNVRQEKVFTVPHQRKANGSLQKVTDPRDIYELVANNGARRLRSCIMGIIPGDIFEMAVLECDKTLVGENEIPLKDRLGNAFNAFKEQHKVTKAQIEQKIGYSSGDFTERDYLDLIQIFNSIKDGVAKVEDHFEKPAKKGAASKLKEELEAKEDIKADVEEGATDEAKPTNEG
ncbi:hypothetical protein HCA84_02465 [Listeria booriae]|uniref:hypothetical protein n=1 Tax=Listeria booriae TaxID=1552123 RepID=UPI0016250BBA|nr:hypothetical protein [Listeria booriae]MBC1974527.1 hypothetical protein [Listeria booriae]MBC2031819.1 hypothetical protein [Listeria booriae]